MLFWLLIIGGAIEGLCHGFDIIDFKGVWMLGEGAELLCTWVFPEDDWLQSVKIYYDFQELASYRPELHGNEYEVLIRHQEDERIFDIKCKNQIFGARQGKCLINTSMDYLPPKNISRYDCEVSGERPRFRTDKKSCAIVPFEPSSDTQIEVKKDPVRDRVSLNCTAHGIPAPELDWHIGSRLVHGDFKGSIWNESSKHWRVWSAVTLAGRYDADLEAVCTPRQKGHEESTPSASFTLKQYNHANKKYFDVFTIFIISMTFSMLR